MAVLTGAVALADSVVSPGARIYGTLAFRPAGPAGKPRSFRAGAGLPFLPEGGVARAFVRDIRDRRTIILMWFSFFRRGCASSICDSRG